MSATTRTHPEELQLRIDSVGVNVALGLIPREVPAVRGPWCAEHDGGTFAPCGQCATARRVYGEHVAREVYDSALARFESQDFITRLRVAADASGEVRGSAVDIARRLYPRGDVDAAELIRRLAGFVGKRLVPVVARDLVVSVRLDDKNERHVVSVGEVNEFGLPIDDGADHDRAPVLGVLGDEIPVSLLHHPDHVDVVPVYVPGVEVEDGPVVVDLNGQETSPSVDDSEADTSEVGGSTVGDAADAGVSPSPASAALVSRAVQALEAVLDVEAEGAPIDRMTIQRIRYEIHQLRMNA